MRLGSLILAAAVAACSGAPPDSGSAGPNSQGSGPEETSTQDSSGVGESEDGGEGGDSMSEILRNARSAPMPHEEPPPSDESADPEDARTATQDLETGLPHDGEREKADDPQGEPKGSSKPERGSDPDPAEPPRA